MRRMLGCGRGGEVIPTLADRTERLSFRHVEHGEESTAVSTGWSPGSTAVSGSSADVTHHQWVGVTLAVSWNSAV